MAVHEVPVIDLFSGPGGLSEGFARYGERDWEAELSPVVEESRARSATAPARRRKIRFRIALSIEKDEWAHRTLELRAFFRQFGGNPPSAYYDHLRGTLSRESLFARYPHQSRLAAVEACRAELGKADEDHIDGMIARALCSDRDWVLIGGPPCQAYSIAGRSRRRGIADYNPLKDERHFLYREYLRIVARHEPPVFVMENVKGMLSSRLNGEPIVERILEDLREPGKALKQKRSPLLRYRLFALAPSEDRLWEITDFHDYVLCMENHGVPQARHRVILLGVREDGPVPVPEPLPFRKPVPARRVLEHLPKLRSGLSRSKDSPESWAAAVAEAGEQDWFRRTENDRLKALLENTLQQLARTDRPRGGRFVPCPPRIDYCPSWFLDHRLGGACNHESRQHIPGDLHRYLYAACYGKVTGRSPRLDEFPPALLPAHRNTELAVENGGYFNDRFRVQLANRPSTTVTSHISKDGHYYIHYDPAQCRALTVREAARLQTFPDNYFFCGNRTQQYHQVGNAVPPLIAVQIAGTVAGLLS
jgi:DNA (cytosine-5)-methyltransferase 1